MSQLTDRIANLPPRKRALLALRLQAQQESESKAKTEPIAVVGIGCRFPGNINSADEFWQVLVNGVDAVDEIPSDRWDVDSYYDPAPATPGKMNTRWGGFINDIDKFDAAFFGISPREAVSLDPQQRVLLEVNWEALEHAGHATDKLSGSQTGVFIGICRNDYGQLHGVTEEPARIDAYFGTGNASCFAAGRISYLLGLHGPSLAVDTACSSSLVTVHLACRSLRAGECRMALAGGVNLILSPWPDIYMSQLRTLAPDGRCKAFDDRADGYVRGEGCGVVVLKRLSDALADNDNVLAVIRGSAVNQDGRSAGMTAPNGPAQEAVMRSALTDAQMDPREVSFIEAHGTGTSLGDPIEIRALAAVFDEGRDWPLMVGSVKSNLGHLEAAAGIAGFIKLVLAVQHGEIPKQLHFREPSSYIPWKDLRVAIPRERMPWQLDQRRRVGAVSSFGFSGTNAHVLVEEWREEATVSGERDDVYVLPFSARDAGALRELAARYVERLARDEAVGDLCYSASVRRAHHRQRVAVVGRSAGELRAQLEAFLSGKPTAGVFTGRAAGGSGVVYVFSGQGAQWWGMGRELAARFLEFRASLAECDELFAQRTQEWRLLEELERGPEESRLDGEEMDLTQCALFALQVSLARLWTNFGVRPTAVVGHSMGEVAAAVAAGVLTLAEGVEVIYERSRLLRRASGRGAMAAVELGEEEAEAAVKALGPQAALVGVAAVNGKRASVVSGEREAVQRLMRELEAKGVMTREVRSSGVAAHSVHVADLGEELVRVLGGIRGRASDVRVVSTVSGRAIAGEEVSASYWRRNLREQVRFRAAMQELAHSGDAVYVEMSAHPVLGLWIREALEEASKPPTVIAALRRERSDTEMTLTGLAELYAAGVSINWEAVWRGRTARYVTLPAYPWQRRRFWIEPPTSRSQSQILTERDLENDPQRNSLVESLIQKWGREGVLAVNRRYLAPFIFVSRTQQSLFYFNLKNRSIVGLMYVGPDDQYGPLVKELREYCQSKRFQLNLIATESGTPALRELGFSTTPCGVLQSITDLKNFTLDGNRMRRLRYLIQRYGGKVKEYKAGSDSNVDEDICNLIDNWIETKKKRVPFSATLKDDIRSGRLDPRLRLFLTYSDERLDSVVVISPAAAANGYLLDLEFYREDGAHGCLEFTIVEIIRTLAGEGCEYLSLGGSFGTQLNEHPNADAQVEQLFATLHDEQILNGDGNCQFKSKFRPETSQLYLCVPKDSQHVGLADVLTTLAGEGASEEELKQLSSSLKLDTAVVQHRSNRSLHPLLGEKLHLAVDEEVFQSYQSIASLSFLGDHAVGGIVVMPGTAYIEMGLAAAQHALGPGAHSIVDLSIQQVMAFPEPDTETTVQLTLKREDGGASFRILSAPAEGGSGQWLLHATGTIRSQAATPVDGSLEAIRSRCTEEITGDAFYELLRRNSLEYGPSFQGVKHVWRRDREALGQIQLPESQSAELGNYRIHPALLDACFQIFEATIETAVETEDAIYLLRGAEEIAVYGEVPKRIWAHAVLRDSDNSDLYAGDLMLYGESERPVAQVKGIYAKRATRNSLVRNTQRHLSDWLYEIRWQLSTVEEYDAAGIQSRAWVIFCDEGGFGKNLEAKLRAHGQPCLLVHPGKDYDATPTGDVYIDPTDPEHFSRVLNEAALASPGLPLGVVFLWTIDTDQTPDIQALDQSIELGCRSVLNLVRAAIDTGARLWLVTCGAQSTGTETVAPAQSALWGMGRVLAAEHPEAFGGLIDLEPGAPSADALFREILCTSDSEDQIVYRAGQRYVARLVRGTIAKHEPVLFKESTTYLITGGLGGLGLECAGWMIDHGARHIALASRRSTSDELQAKISHWEKQGATIRVFRTDVTGEDQIKDLVAGIEQSMPPLKGIIHAAGVVEDGMAHKQTWEQFQRVLGPKVRGAYALHLHTSHLSLDFFTLFSSAASMFGSVGQINHAAANAFLDGLAHHRKAQGLPALSINWGAWSEIGEAAKQNVPERLAPKGIDAIEPEHGWRVFEMIFNHPAAQVGVVPIDWERWQRRYTGKAPPMMAQLMQESKPARSNQGRRDLIEAFFSVDPDKQQEKLEEYLIHEAARVLRMEPASLDPQQPLSTFGLDSIMTVELRDRIDAEWQVRVPLVEFFREPTIGRLSSIMLEQLRSLNPAQQSSPVDPAELLNRLDQMSETEMDKLLDVMLAEQDAAQSETAVASV